MTWYWRRLGVGKGVSLVLRACTAVTKARCFPSEEILSYVLVQVQPPQPGLPRPRFSLYLSAQLQIGVIRVYSQQCQYLVGKAGKAARKWGGAEWPSAGLALYLALPAHRGHPAHPGAPAPSPVADPNRYGGD